MNNQNTLRLDLYLRTETRGLADRRQQAFREEAKTLETTGVVDTVDVFEVPRKLPVADPDHPADARDIYNRLTKWARDEDVTLTPAFGTRTCYSRTDGNRDTNVVFPVMTLAVYEDDDLVAVYPHTDGDQYYTVFDGLDAVRTRKTDQEHHRTPVPAE